MSPPAHVEREFRRYLECGILAHGFGRARCGQCGHDFLISFSCKGRAVCPSEPAAELAHRHAARYAWALLLARIYEVFPLRCTHCGGEMRIIAFITDAPTVRDLLAHLGEPTAPPRIAPARGPPLWEAAMPARTGHTAPGDPLTQPVPAYEFDQRIAW